MTGVAISGHKYTGLTTGTIDYPSNWTLGTAEDVNLIVLGGDCTTSNKTTTGFDVTVGAGTGIVLAIPERPGIMLGMPS